MTSIAPRPPRFLAVVLALAVALVGSTQARAAEAPVGLGSATSYAVLAGQTVTNTGPSVITGDVGLSPGSSVVGFPPGTVNGATHVADSQAVQAQSDLTAAYGDAAGRAASATLAPELGGLVLLPGVYTGGSFQITGTLTLDAQGDPNAVFVFQSASTLVSAANSTVAFVNGGNPCNVFWQVTSSATLGTNSIFVGIVLALTSIAANTGATITGALLARNGEVTLDNNTINRTSCTAVAPTTTTIAATTTTPGAATTTTPGAATTTTPGAVTTATIAFTVPPGPLPETGSAITDDTALVALLSIIAGAGTIILLRRHPRRDRGSV